MTYSAQSASSAPQANARFHASTQGVAQIGLQHSVVRLRSWPILSTMPPELTPDIARVCALLAVRPTGVPLVHLLLALPRDHVCSIIGMLHELGHLSSATQVNPNATLTAQRPDELNPTDLVGDAVSPPSTLVQRLWRRLTTPSR